MGETITMPTYIGLLKWTDEGIKGAKDALNRRRLAAERVGRMGGRMIASYWTQGAYDIVSIVEYPDEETAVASALATGMQGVVRSESPPGNLVHVGRVDPVAPHHAVAPLWGGNTSDGPDR